MPKPTWIAVPLLLSAVAATSCGGSNAGKTLVFEVSGSSVGQTDPSLCASGVTGLEIDLAIREAIAFTIDDVGQSAFLATCGVASGQVTDCQLLPPGVELDLDEDRITGDAVGRLLLAEGEACEGADIEIGFDMILAEDSLSVQAVATWRLDPSAACDALEGDVRAQDPLGLGINGCVVQYAFEASKLAECDFSRATPCSY